MYETLTPVSIEVLHLMPSVCLQLLFAAKRAFATLLHINVRCLPLQLKNILLLRDSNHPAFFPVQLKHSFLIVSACVDLCPDI